MQLFTGWTSADVHFMLLGVTWLKPCRTQRESLPFSLHRTAESQLGRKDMAQLERSIGMPRGLGNLTQKAHIPKENAQGKT